MSSDRKIVRSLATNRITMTTLLLACAAANPFARVASAGSEQVSFTENDIRSIFHIAKSENRNQVHYGIHVDALCRPDGTHPVFVYWREFEKGPQVISSLLDREQPVYGIREQHVQILASTVGRVKLTIEALPDRTISVESYRDESNRCTARAVVEINRERCILRSIYVDVGFLYSVDKITLVSGALREGEGTCAPEVIRPGQR
jgi:hypothetical protein